MPIPLKDWPLTCPSLGVETGSFQKLYHRKKFTFRSDTVVERHQTARLQRQLGLAGVKREAYLRACAVEGEAEELLGARNTVLLASDGAEKTWHRRFHTFESKRAVK